MSPGCPRTRKTRPCFPRVSGDEPLTLTRGLLPECFPRVSGDEPFDGNFFGVEEEFSPRERG